MLSLFQLNYRTKAGPPAMPWGIALCFICWAFGFICELLIKANRIFKLNMLKFYFLVYHRAKTTEWECRSMLRLETSQAHGSNNLSPKVWKTALNWAFAEGWTWSNKSELLSLSPTTVSLSGGSHFSQNSFWNFTQCKLCPLLTKNGNNTRER